MNKRILHLVIILIGMAFIYACGEEGENGNGGEKGIPTTVQPETPVVPGIDVQNIIQSLPSPIEMAALIKSSGVPFSKSYLAVPQDVDDFETNFKKALGLGVLSADLGYLNVYEKNNEIVNFLGSIRTISDDLNIGQFFDFHSLKEIATSGDNLDTLIFLSQTSFRQMDEHLRKINRSNLSALVVTGVWVEGLYLLTQIVKEDQTNEDLKESVGQQKASLEMLNKVIQSYKSLDRNFEILASDMEKLMNIYNQIIIEETDGVIKTIIIDSIPVKTTTGKSIVKMTDEQLTAIIRLTEEIRAKLVSF